MTRKMKVITAVLVSLLSIVAVWVALHLHPTPSLLETVSIDLSPADFDHLNQKVEDAHELGYYKKGDDEYVPAQITYRSHFSDGKVRLKGDWLDHFSANKWSFRIKQSKALASGIKSYSIQNPKARGFIDGWVFQQLMRQEGVMANEFRFVQLKLNQQNWGIYSFEEHLSQRMIDEQAGANGIILKFKDDGFFKADIEKQPTDGLIKEAEIKVYGKLKDDPDFQDDIRFAKKLMRAYQLQVDSVYDYFNAEKMGAYYALCDLNSAYHAMGWINIRFFYNFETKLLEPIAYDPYPLLEWGKPYLGANVDKVNNDPFETTMIVYNALKYPKIRAAYDRKIKVYSDQQFVSNFLNSHQEQIQFYETELKKEYPDYQYDYSFLKENAKNIKTALEK